ncbi:MAG: putative O-glycosylation ligase, exosortase A system-associated [Alphaproteobacteria bacterium]|nr:putative O-glycosylation ligase, exosortase A system-associated [Alphaproteobacteria bacterium]
MPGIFLHPFTGVLMYVWFSLMNPHQLTWGFAQSIPTAFIIALMTMVAFFLDKKRSLPKSPIFVLICCFMVTLTISAIFSLTPEISWDLWNRYMKTLFFCLLAFIMMTTKLRVQALVWVAIVSLGYFGIKGGAFSINTLGQYRFQGPDGTQIGDNNHMALALLMTLPLMNYLRLTTKNKLAQYVLLLSMCLTFLAVLTTYSRGGMIGLAAVTIFLWFKSKHKMRSLLFLSVLAIAALSFMPDKFFNRADTIQTAEKDDSFRGRLDAWHYAWNVALSRPMTGGGISSTIVPYIFQKYNQESKVTQGGRAAHSIYFQVLGDQGFIGLFIFLSMITISWFNGSWLIKNTRGLAGHLWVQELSKMLQVGVIAYIVAGAALSMAYYDLFYIYAIILARLRLMVQEVIVNNRIQGLPSIAQVISR